MLSFITGTTGAGEWCVLLAVALIVAGPKRLPALAREFGRMYAKFCRVAEGFRRQLFELEAEINHAEDKADKALEDAFKSEGDESKAKPVMIA